MTDLLGPIRELILHWKSPWYIGMRDMPEEQQKRLAERKDCADELEALLPTLAGAIEANDSQWKSALMPYGISTPEQAVERFKLPLRHSHGEPISCAQGTVEGKPQTEVSTSAVQGGGLLEKLFEENGECVFCGWPYKSAIHGYDCHAATLLNLPEGEPIDNSYSVLRTRKGLIAAALAHASTVTVHGGITFKCKARTANMGDIEPQDCDWPVCGCDPYADKVIETLQESGLLAMTTPSGSREAGRQRTPLRKSSARS